MGAFTPRRRSDGTKNNGISGFHFQRIWSIDVRYMANVYPQPNFKTIGGLRKKDEHHHPISKHCFHWATSTITMDWYKLHLSTPHDKLGTGTKIHAQTSSGGKIQRDTLTFLPHDSIQGVFLSDIAVQQANHYPICLAVIRASRLYIADFNLLEVI